MRIEDIESEAGERAMIVTPTDISGSKIQMDDHSIQKAKNTRYRESAGKRAVKAQQ